MNIKVLPMRLAGILVFSMLAIPVAESAGPANPTHLKGHPRVNQVNRRVQHQQRRIAAGVRSGKLTKQQAQQLNAERKGIKTEERAMRKADHGHLTKQDHRILNQQLNERSKQIHEEKHAK